MTLQDAHTVDFKNLAQSMPSGIVLLSAQGRVTWQNKVAVQWFSSIKGQLWRDVINSFLSSNPNDGDELILKSNQKIKVETCALEDRAGQAIIMHDLTHSRFVQDRLNQEKRLQILGNMSANLAHQIRNPLCAAMIQLQSLQKRYPSEEKLEKISGNLKSIEKEINSILFFSRSDQTIVESLNFESLVHEAIEISNLESKEIAIDLKCSFFTSWWVLGNKQALLGALTNVIANAIEASAAKEVVTIDVTERVDDLQILIKDQGPGIDSFSLAQIFEPFYTTKATGTGLGLSIAKTIIANHRGELVVSSVIHQGTEVRIILPKGTS